MGGYLLCEKLEILVRLIRNVPVILRITPRVLFIPFFLRFGENTIPILFKIVCFLPSYMLAYIFDGKYV